MTNATIRTNYHFFAKDEFFIKDNNGKEIPITYSQANFAVRYWKQANVQPTYEIVAANCKE